MPKKNLNPKKTDDRESVQKFVPIGQDVPTGGIEIQPSQSAMDELALKSTSGAAKLHKDYERPPVKINPNELDQLEAKGNPDSRSSKTGDSKIPPPIKIGPKGTIDKTYKIQPEDISTKKK